MLRISLDAQIEGLATSTIVLFVLNQNTLCYVIPCIATFYRMLPRHIVPRCATPHRHAQYIDELYAAHLCATCVMHIKWTMTLLLRSILSTKRWKWSLNLLMRPLHNLFFRSSLSIPFFFLFLILPFSVLRVSYPSLQFTFNYPFCPAFIPSSFLHRVTHSFINLLIHSLIHSFFFL